MVKEKLTASPLGPGACFERFEAPSEAAAAELGDVEGLENMLLVLKLVD